jgi:L-2-hydroxyglutarate oxidase LhgO
MTEKLDCAVIGAGVVGLAIARELALAGREVVILEAEHAIGTQTSSRNSELIHAGIYYPTDSLKARFCVAGRKAMYEYCAERGVSYRRIGKVIVAVDESELAGLNKHKQLAESNGVDDLRMLTRAELAALEPEVNCVAGFLSPSSGIVDSHGLMLAYLADAENHGAALALNSPITGGRVTGEGILLDVGGTQPTQIACNTVVNAAGHGAPGVSRSIRGIPAQTIPPNYYAIGHYYTLSGRTPFNHLVSITPRNEWFGIYATIDIGGRCKFGPDFDWIDTLDYRFNENREAQFYEVIRRYYPGLKDGALQPGYTGIRPRITGKGEAAVDFLIQSSRDHGIVGMVNLYGIESPGLTSSLAIGAYVRSLLDNE